MKSFPRLVLFKPVEQSFLSRTLQKLSFLMPFEGKTFSRTSFLPGIARPAVFQKWVIKSIFNQKKVSNKPALMKTHPARLKALRQLVILGPKRVDKGH